MFKNIKIENFRSITDLEIADLRQFNLIVGKNNVGKSTILEAIFLLINPSNAELPLKLNTIRNINPTKLENLDLLFNNLKSNIDVKLSCEFYNSEVRYLKIRPLFTSSITISPFESTNKIGTNNLTNHDGIELLYSFKNKNNVNELISSLKINESHKGPEIKLSSKNPPSYLTKLNGLFISSKSTNDSDSIGKRFGRIVENNKEDRIIKIAKEIDPQIKDLKLGPDNTVLCDVGLNRSLPLNVMGEGLIKVLGIIVGIAEVENGVLIIDEIENGLHVSSQEILWKAVFDTAKEFNTQIFATTHSSECLDAMILSLYDTYGKDTDEVRLFRVERDLNKFKTISYTPELLFTSLEEGWEVR